MTVLFSLSVNKLYDLVRRKQVNTWSPAVHYHVDCGQSFACLWPSVSSGMGKIVDPYISNEFYCPQCGELIRTRGGDGFCVADTSGTANVPLDIELSVIDRGTILDVKFDYHTVYVDNDTQSIYPGYKPHLIDILRFDFRQGKVFLVQKKRTRADIISEIEPNISSFYSKSLPLYWLVATPNCRLSQYKKELQTFAKVLKQAYFAKLSKRVGYQVKPIRQGVLLSSKYGALDNLLHNLVWKMHAPDAPALNDKLVRDHDSYFRPFGAKTTSTSVITDLTSAGVPFIKALIQLYKVPDKRWVRKLLTIRPFFYIKVIQTASKVFKSMDYQKAFTDLVAEEGGKTGYIQSWPIWNDGQALLTVTDFLKLMRHQYGERRVLLFLKNADSYSEVKDTADMYNRLSRARKKEIWARRIQIKDLHDEIVCISKFEKAENVPVQCSMLHSKLIDSVGGLDFTVVKTTHDIIRLGVQLNNCVGTYVEKVKEQKCAIVGVFENSRPVACIEVNPTNTSEAFTVIHQAKLKNNRGVRDNHNINYAVCQWVKKHRLQVPKYLGDIQFAKGGAM